MLDDLYEQTIATLRENREKLEKALVRPAGKGNARKS